MIIATSALVGILDQESEAERLVRACPRADSGTSLRRRRF
jgi:uncharacterized protein with PIN domain